jgi:hypothetical protein
MTIDGESYDPFSAETLRVLPATHPSYHKEIIEASRRKYAILAGEAQRLIAEEEATIIRSAQEKAAITGGKGENAEGYETEEEKFDNEQNKEKIQEVKKEKKGGEPLI